LIVVGLKRYFSTVSGPSLGTDTAAPEEQIEVAAAAPEHGDGLTPIAETEAQAEAPAQEEPQEQGDGECITEFSPEHIIADP
jgi:hypothetical protein